MKHTLCILLSLIILLGTVLTACGQGDTETPTVTVSTVTDEEWQASLSVERYRNVRAKMTSNAYEIDGSLMDTASMDYVCAGDWYIMTEETNGVSRKTYTRNRSTNGVVYDYSSEAIANFLTTLMSDRNVYVYDETTRTYSGKSQVGSYNHYEATVTFANGLITEIFVVMSREVNGVLTKIQDMKYVFSDYGTVDGGISSETVRTAVAALTNESALTGAEYRGVWAGQDVNGILSGEVLTGIVSRISEQDYGKLIRVCYCGDALEQVQFMNETEDDFDLILKFDGSGLTSMVYPNGDIQRADTFQ